MAVLVVAGCTSTAMPASKVRTTSPLKNSAISPVTPSRTTPIPTSAPTVVQPAAKISYRLITSTPLPSERSVTNIALFGHYLAWDGCTGCTESHQPTTLYVEDLHTKKVMLVAHTAWTGGELSWQVGTGDYIVWTDQSGVPTEGMVNPQWSMWAQDLATGKRWLIARNHGSPPSPGPLPQSAEGVVVWTRDDADHRTEDVMVQDLATRTTRVVVHQVLPFTASITAARIVYDDTFPPDQPGANLDAPPKAREVYSVPLAGGHPTDLGGSHDAHSPSAGGSWATWGEPKYGDQHTIWAAPADGSNPAHLVYRGLNLQQAPGDRFLAFWNESNGVFVTGIDRNTPVINAQPPGEQNYVPAHFSAFGDALAFATVQHMEEPNELVTLRIDRISVPPAG